VCYAGYLNLPIDIFSQPPIMGLRLSPQIFFQVFIIIATMDRTYNIYEPLMFLSPDAKPAPASPRNEVLDGTRNEIYLRASFFIMEKITPRTLRFNRFTKNPENKLFKERTAAGMRIRSLMISQLIY
jgi:hypothetical protein